MTLLWTNELKIWWLGQQIKMIREIVQVILPIVSVRDIRKIKIWLEVTFLFTCQGWKIRTRKFHALYIHEFCLWKNRLMIKESNYVPTPKVRSEFLGCVAYRINHRFQCASWKKIQSCERKLNDPCVKKKRKIGG